MRRIGLGQVVTQLRRPVRIATVFDAWDDHLSGTGRLDMLSVAL
jgi:hypothetical protein